MADYHGYDGIVKVGGSAVGSVQRWNVDQRAETTQGYGMGDAWMATRATVKSFEGSMEFYYDPTETAGANIVPGDTLSVELFPGGEATGNAFFSGSVVVTGVPLSVPKDGWVTKTVNFQGDGALTESTAP